MISPIYPQGTKPEGNSPELLSKLNLPTGSIPVGTTRLTAFCAYPFHLLNSKFFYPSTIPHAGAPLPVKVALSFAPGHGDIPGTKDGAKNRPETRGRSAAANPTWLPGAFGITAFLPLETPGEFSLLGVRFFYAGETGGAKWFRTRERVIVHYPKMAEQLETPGSLPVAYW